MIATTLFALSSLQIDGEYWPTGYFDIVGEMTYVEAADAIGVRPPRGNDYASLVSEVKKDPTSVVLWKAIADQCIVEKRWIEFYRLCTDFTGGQANLQNGKSSEISNAVGYSLYSLKSHFGDKGIVISEDLRKKWSHLLSVRQVIFGGTRNEEAQILVQLTSQRGSPKIWRELLSKYEGKIECGYYLHYSRAESYMFGEQPTDPQGRAIGPGTPMNLDKALSEFMLTHELYQKRATPCFKIAALLWERNHEKAKIFARKYLALENRPNKGRWRAKMSELAK